MDDEVRKQIFEDFKKMITTDDTIVYCGGMLSPHIGTNTLEMYRMKDFTDFHADSFSK